MKHQYATLTNRLTGRSTCVRLEPNNWVSVKNYRAAQARINTSGGWNPMRSSVEFIIYDKHGPRDIVSQTLEG